MLFRSRHRALAVLERGSSAVYTVRGVDPGEDAWRMLGHALHDRGWRLRRSYGTTGALGAVATPGSITRSDALAALEHLTAAWPRPIAWQF